MMHFANGRDVRCTLQECSGSDLSQVSFQVLDFLQNKDGKALVLTSCSAIYLDLARQRARWAVPLAALVGVSSSGAPAQTSWTTKSCEALMSCTPALLESSASACCGMPLPPSLLSGNKVVLHLDVLALHVDGSP